MTVTRCVALPLFPAASVTLALMVTVPFASAETTLAGTPTLQLPLASSTVVKVFVPDRHRHGAAGCRTRGGAADNLRLGVFRRVDHIIACHRVDGDDRNRRIHRQVVIPLKPGFRLCRSPPR